MRPRNIGRALGIGVRVAGRIAGQRIAGPAQSGPSVPRAMAQSGAVASASATQAQPQARAAGRTQLNPAATSAGVSAASSRPFRRVGGIVWLEVTGTFFLLFAAVFALRLWQTWPGMGRVSRGFVIGTAGGFSLPGRQFILAGAAPLTMTFGSSFSPAR